MAWSDFFKGAVDVGKALLGVAAKATATVIHEAKEFVDKVWAVAQKTFRGDPETEKERLERDLQDVNERIQHLRKRYRENNGLTSTERREWDHLRDQRGALNARLREVEQGTNADELLKKQKDYKPIEITNDTSHILQYHVGQSTFNKICSCGRTMVLQWDRRLVTPGLKDFFWGCSGWYIQHNEAPVCEGKQPLEDGDLSLFANLNRPEFDATARDLTQIALVPERAKRIRAALDSIRDQHRARKMGIKTYRCPIHGESLVLQRNRKTDKGLLDEYFLGCPRYLPDKAGCNFLVKLKSAAQISSVFDVENKKGLLSLTG